MQPKISLIIPNFNGESTLNDCLCAAFASDYADFEVIVVDDCSLDRSVEIIQRFPCRLIQLPEHRGASAARNAGARASKGSLLFFTDADCVLHPQALSISAQMAVHCGSKTVIGGTYQLRSFDNRFCSRFQSVFIHYSETKNAASPDYIASHAMIMCRDEFLANGGFKEQWLPILEDVEFSHRLLRSGYNLTLNPRITAQHIFNYSWKKSCANAFRKSRYWIEYSLSNHDLFSDSGTASYELKTNVAIFIAIALCVVLGILLPQTLAPIWISLASICAFANLLVNRRLLTAFYSTYGLQFALGASLYYCCFYPLPVSTGAALGFRAHLNKQKRAMVEI